MKIKPVTVRKFVVKGLFGHLDVNAPINQNRLVLIGPNGTGKSTIINLFYFMYTRQWHRMVEYDFHSAEITFSNNGKAHVTKDDLIQIEERKSLRPLHYPTRAIKRAAELISSHPQFDEISGSASKQNSISIQNDLQISTGLYRAALAQLRYEASDPSSYDRYKELNDTIEKNANAMTFYLPTYRRIERELSSIFPDIEERFRRSFSEELLPGHRSHHYEELVSFGMEDVAKLLSSSLGKLREFARGRLNNLAGSYLRDVIRDEASNYDRTLISQLDDQKIANVLLRVDEHVLAGNDKLRIKEAILGIQKSGVSNEVGHREQYLAHYFGMLVNIDSEIQKQEKDISAFALIADEYLGNNKSLKFDETSYNIRMTVEDDKEIDLIDLSSGEKQIVSIFAHMYLGETPPYSVIIDEPELSLSVPWQERFLPDIWKSGKCDLLLAVTHSPFIYHNEFEECAVDVRDLIKNQT